MQIIFKFILMKNLIFLFQLSAFHLIIKEFICMNFLITIINFLTLLFLYFWIRHFIREFYHFNLIVQIFLMFLIDLSLVYLFLNLDKQFHFYSLIIHLLFFLILIFSSHIKFLINLILNFLDSKFNLDQLSIFSFH